MVHIKPGSGLKSAATGAHLTLGPCVGEGGEGQVFEIIERPGMLAKIYKSQPDAKTTAKLKLLVSRQSSALSSISAWPEDLAVDGSTVVGFIMPAITGAKPLHEIATPMSRLKHMPDTSILFLVVLATNLAKAIGAFHKEGLVVGDINSKNILFRADATVRFIDVDSVQSAGPIPAAIGRRRSTP